MVIVELSSCGEMGVGVLRVYGLLGFRESGCRGHFDGSFTLLVF